MSTSLRDQVLDGYAQGRSIRELAEMTGRSYNIVRATLLNHGVALRRRGPSPSRSASASVTELAALLLAARAASGMSGRQAGALAEMSQSKLSKLENGLLAPHVDDVRKLARCYEVAPGVRDRMVELAQAGSLERRRRVLLHHVGKDLLPAVRRVELTAQIIRVLVLGAFPEQALHPVRNGARLVVVATETALRSPRVPLERIRLLRENRAVEWGVIPLTAPVELPNAGFVVFDDRMSVTELSTGVVVATRSEEVRFDLEIHREVSRHADFTSSHVGFPARFEELSGE
ncbi:helix-turn-helix domain-containing protein [Actinosynnema mirum]|uniref:helix-turn-helix domain-containing protein n=1 Tax=Actinosynnema mirum TaxID=40567 RepID=UPI00019ABA6E|nr:helix-turn-helix domain-containing protein [Actinosynnema mirum]